MSVTMIGALNGVKISFIAATGLCERVPITTRSGFIRSSTAKPSRRNPGLPTTSTSPLVSGFPRHRALVHYYLVRGTRVGNAPRDGLNEPQIDRAVSLRRRWHGD